MIFSTPIFLFGFLPLVLLAYFSSPRATKNITLLVFSLLFYAWGEVFYVLVMIASILANYAVGCLIYRYRNNSKYKKKCLVYGIVINLALLVFFKYANFIVDNCNILLSRFHFSPIDLPTVHLPLGISFFTFQAMSYLVDVYRKKAFVQKNLISLALYISLFPQLIAGPIVRYLDVSRQIDNRSHSVALFAEGVQRFIYGLSKKMLLANPLGEVADPVFLLQGDALTMPLAWVGIVAYTLQIFFDFSGYSDMAIGLGKMFGFTFHENFNYPYIARSLREFWRRWHISLSTWFRDYVYISLGGNRGSSVKVYCNLLVVFILTGVWHGASWNYLLWGLFHGLFIIVERVGFDAVLERTWKPLQHLYLLAVIVTGWVLFRADTLECSQAYFVSMLDFNKFYTSSFQFAQVLSNESILALIFGLFLSVPVLPTAKRMLNSSQGVCSIGLKYFFSTIKIVYMAVLFFVSVLKVSSGTYNPFLYFRF